MKNNIQEILKKYQHLNLELTIHFAFNGILNLKPHIPAHTSKQESRKKLERAGAEIRLNCGDNKHVLCVIHFINFLYRMMRLTVYVQSNAISNLNILCQYI